MAWRRLENQSAPMKMAAARNTSAGAVFPVPAGTRKGTAAMATPITTVTTLRRPVAGGVTGVIPGGSGVAALGRGEAGGATKEVIAAPR